MRTRPVLHEAKDEAEARYYEGEAEAKKLAFRSCWPQGLNIHALYCYNLESLGYMFVAIVWVNFHSYFRGGLRKTHVF